jgi:hypothetical protein
MSNVIKQNAKLIGISSFIILLLILPSLSMAEIQIDWNTMVVTDTESCFVFDPSGYMCLKFGDGCLEIWAWNGFRWWLSNGVLFVDGYDPW